MNKNIKKILFIIIPIIIIAIIIAIIILINNIKKETNELNDKMNQITNSYQLLETNSNIYNNNRKTLSESLNNSYIENLEKDYDKYINILKEQENTIETIHTSIDDISDNCEDRLFSRKEVNNICSTYKEYYEIVVNVFIKDQAQVNKMINKYNEDATNKLNEYKSNKLIDYIDYNQDGIYLERED